MQTGQYVPHGTNTMGNGNIMELVAEHGMEGYGIYWMLMEHLCQQADGKSTVKVIKILCKKMEVSTQKLNRILNNSRLFSIKNEEVSSPELDKKRAAFEEKRKKLSRAGRKGYEVKTLKNNGNTPSSCSSHPQAIYNTVVDDNSRIKPVVQGWEAAVETLAAEEYWKELMAMRSGMGELFMKRFPEILAFFKRHIVSYGKEDSILSEKDAKNYFSNFISQGSTTHTKLLAQLNKTKENDPYRYEERNAKGERSYCGLPIPVDAPPRPSGNALWNGKGWD